MKYRYYVKLNYQDIEYDNYNIKYDTFINIIRSVKCKKYKINHDAFSFYVNKDIKKYLSEEQLSKIIINNVFKKYSLNFLKKYFISLLFIVIFIMLIIILNKTIIKIEFTNNEYYSKEVYDTVKENINYIYKFGYLNKDLETINKDLRSKFYQYQWINIEKKGTKLLINISKTNDDKVDNSEKRKGSLYSKYDAYILGYYCEQGKVIIQNNIFVNKGDELISGNVPGYNNNNNLVTAKGYVIGEVTEYISLNIKKVTVNEKRTGNMVKKISFKPSFNNIKFEKYDYEIHNIFKIGNFSLKKIYYYEKKEYKELISKDEAINIGINKINYLFNENKKYKFEKIISIKDINIVDKETYFQIHYKVNKIIDITEFISYE